MANINMVKADLVKWVAWGLVRITQLTAFNPNAGTVYIQFHEVPPLANGTLTDQAIPAFKAIPVVNGTSVDLTQLDINLKECLIAMSSTDATYTAVAAGGGLNCSFEASSSFLCDGTEVVVGDLTTNVLSLQVWAEATAPKRLLRIDAIDSAGSITGRFLVLRTTDADAQMPFWQLFFVASGGSISMQFGVNGYVPLYTQDADPAPKDRTGCTLIPVYPGNTIGGIIYQPTFPYSDTDTNFHIRAIYKPF